MKLLIFIPCFNEALHLGEVIERIPSKIEGVSTIEILVIDDGSTDNTSGIASTIKDVRVLKNTSNQGISYTFQRGIKYAIKSGADIAVNMDGDGQFSPEEIPLLYSSDHRRKSGFCCR